MSFYTDVIQKSPKYHSTEVIRDLALLEPVTRRAIIQLVAEAARMNLPLMVFETYRSQERQMELFTRHATQLSTVGVHHYGLAADVVRLVDGKPNWMVDYRFLGLLARKYGLVWGGDWAQPGVKHSFVDADHLQRIAVDHQPALFNASWYPDQSYSAYGVSV